MFIQPHFCLGVSRVSVHIFTCVFVISLTLFLHLFLTGKPQAYWIGYTLSSSYITLLQLCFSLCHLFPCAMEQTLSLEWLDISLLTLCPLPFMLSLLKKTFLFGLLFIY